MMRWLLAVVMMLLSSATFGAPGTFANQGLAYAACMADGAQRIADNTGGNERNTTCTEATGLSSSWGGYTGRNERRSCPSCQWNGTINFGNYLYPVASTCANREHGPGGNAVLFAGSGLNPGVCHQGCWFGMTSSGKDYRFGGSDKSVMTSTGLAPTGGVCTNETPARTDQQCVQQGTLTQCVKPNGEHCAQASNGTQFCWKDTEEGVKTAPNGNEAQTKSQDNKPINAPKTPPKNGGDWTVVNQTTTTINNNGESKTYNNTTFNSNYGTQGNGSTGGGGSDGGSGGDGGDGDGDGDEGGNDPGGVGEGIGDVYQGTDLTITGLLAQHYNNLSNTPIMASVSNFMMVSGGGSCPVFALSATQWTPALSFSAHCSGEVYAVLLAMGWVLLGIVSYFAIRIAVT